MPNVTNSLTQRKSLRPSDDFAFPFTPVNQGLNVASGRLGNSCDLPVKGNLAADVERVYLAASRRMARSDALALILRREYLKNPKGKQFPGQMFPQIDCGRVRTYSTVSVVRSTGGVCTYQGLVTCQNNSCPVCASAKQSRNRLQLQAALAAAKAMGLQAFMLTLTLPHLRSDSLGDSLGDLAQAIGHFRNSGGYKRLKMERDAVGHIKALEILYGRNGWHPHTHEVHFYRGAVPPDLAERLTALWVEALRKVGRVTTDQQAARVARSGLDVRTVVDSLDYLAKLPSELTGAETKVDSSGLTMFQLLDRYSAAREASDYNETSRLSRLVLEYVRDSKSRKILDYSRGLKALLGVADTEDADEDQEPQAQEGQAAPEAATVLGEISAREWSFILRKRLRYEVLRLFDRPILPGDSFADRLLLFLAGHGYEREQVPIPMPPPISKYPGLEPLNRV